MQIEEDLLQRTSSKWCLSKYLLRQTMLNALIQWACSQWCSLQPNINDKQNEKNETVIPPVASELLQDKKRHISITTRARSQTRNSSARTPPNHRVGALHRYHKHSNYKINEKVLFLFGLLIVEISIKIKTRRLFSLIALVCLI